MARISTYPIDSNVVGSDKWIGTDSQDNKKTKNFTADGVAAFFNTKGIIESQALRYTYQNVSPGEARQAETISFATELGNSVLFSSISSWMISKYAKPSKLVETFYTAPLVGRQILISNAANPSDWGIFDWNSSTKDSLEPNFYDIGLTLINSTGSLVDGQDYFISLLGNTSGGGGGGDKNFVYNQPTPSLVWDVVHNLDKYPSVSVVDSAGTTVFGNVRYRNVNELTITFKGAFSGKAYIN
jgi:hypothetical protein